MEQIQQLLEILKQTPEMALWGLGLFFLFTLLKLASWIYGFKVVSMYSIKRLFDYLEKKNDLKKLDFEYKKEQLAYSDAEDIISHFNKRRISGVSKKNLIRLMDSLVRDNLNYIFEDDIEKAIKVINESKKKE